MKKTTLPVKSRIIKKKSSARHNKKKNSLANNLIGVAGLIVVVVGVAVALALTAQNQDTRQQAIFKGTQPTPETFCGLSVKDDFSRPGFKMRWSRDGSNVLKKNAVKRENGILKLDTLTARPNRSRESGVYQSRAIDGRFTGRITLRRLQYANRNQVQKNQVSPGYFALEQYHYVTPQNSGYNSLRITPQPDGTFRASLVSIENGNVIAETVANDVIPQNARNLRLHIQRKGGKLYGRVLNKRQAVDILLGPIDPWNGSGSLALHLYANPNNRLTASLDNFYSNFCVKSCQGISQAENFQGDINDNWFVYQVSNDDKRNGKMQLRYPAGKDGFGSAFLKSKAVSRAAQTSIASIDLTETKIPKRSQMRFLLTNEAESKYAAILIQQNKTGRLVMRSAFNEYGKMKVSRTKRAVIPDETQKLRIRISRVDKKVQVSYKLDNQPWTVLSKYNFYIGPARTKIEIRKIKAKAPAQDAVVSVNAIRMGCSGALPIANTIVVPEPDTETDLSESSDLEDLLVGVDPIELDDDEEDEFDDEDFLDDGWDWDGDEDWMDEEDDDDFDDEG